MADKDKDHAGAASNATVAEVKSIDVSKNTFDGQKADLYINTNRLGGRHFLVKVADASGRPTLIAIHL